MCLPFTSRVIVAPPRAVHAGPEPAARLNGPRRGTRRNGPVSNPNALVVSYLAAWNERDAARRRELIARAWTEEGTYVDAHRRGVGHAGIDAMIGATQEQFPGYSLRLVSGIEAHNDYVRFSWAAGG